MTTIGQTESLQHHKRLVFDLLDYFATRNLRAKQSQIHNGAQKNIKLIRITNIVWNIPANAQSGDTVYSDSFTVGEITYKSV